MICFEEKHQVRVSCTRRDRDPVASKTRPVTKPDGLKVDVKYWTLGRKASRFARLAAWLAFARAQICGRWMSSPVATVTDAKKTERKKKKKDS